MHNFYHIKHVMNFVKFQRGRYVYIVQSVFLLLNFSKIELRRLERNTQHRNLILNFFLTAKSYGNEQFFFLGFLNIFSRSRNCIFERDKKTQRCVTFKRRTYIVYFEAVSMDFFSFYGFTIDLFSIVLI